MDQTAKCETIIEEVFGPSWKAQPPSSSFSIPMKTGTMQPSPWPPSVAHLRLVGEGLQLPSYEMPALLLPSK
jgi:hypothetical protein